MKKNGFTLVELLATITILALLIIIAATKGFGAFNNTKVAIDNMNVDAIKEAANVFMTDVEFCDDDVDEDLINATSAEFSISNKSCKAIRDFFKNSNPHQISVAFLKNNGYINGSDLENYTAQQLANIKIDAALNPDDNSIIITFDTEQFDVDDKEGTIKYYVDNDKGNDSNSGSKTKPFKTLSKALQKSTADNKIILLSDVTTNGITDFKNIKIECNEYSITGNNEVITNTDNISDLTKLHSLITIQDFNFTGEVQTLTLEQGKYILEVWGAEGGNRGNSGSGGKGGYSKGTISLSTSENIFIYVGGNGTTNNGFNGGGLSGTSEVYGGGATDIRIKNDSLYARVIVAGGGGSVGKKLTTAGAGGGIAGQNTMPYNPSTGHYVYGNGGEGATQISGGAGSTYNGISTAGTFGIGGIGIHKNNGYGGAGGGGFYGGAGTVPDSSADDDKGGGGGSGWIYTSDNYNIWKNGNSTDANNYLLNSDYYLTEAETKAGTMSFLSPSGDTITGNSGSGFARISHLYE